MQHSIPMDWTRRRWLAAAGLGISGLAPRARAEGFPGKPVRVVVPWAAGGGGDVVVRMLGARLGERLGQQVVVENRGGATGTIGSALVAKSPADGYTLVYATSDSHSIFPNLLKQPPYDARTDFSAVAPIGYFQFGLAVHPSVPVQTAAELLALARRETVTYGTWGVGSSAHVAIESWRQAEKLDLRHVPYQGTAPLLVGLVGGQLQAAVLPMQIAEQHMRGGGLRMLGLASPERTPNLPQLPTLMEQGVALDLRSWVGFMGPARLPPEVLALLHREISAVIAEPAIQDKLRALYVQTDAQPQAQYQRFVDGEYARWAKLVRESRVVLDS
ncbi:Bug family tripartite tricarboxylate transporter substrate binding protein [Pseudorhodoferax sp.]|uniref:Bug family tripartite tricarboxylate transporter substrate binding protein n=1 Tax=Pseudorhodoferax sp. TaxID=1993553 RepID=UPI002DD66608|nr:tripartite tricarboxylate transporter substrate binding protein [Pseudorhodoferax sp.]